jgi:hypothetical protein
MEPAMRIERMLIDLSHLNALRGAEGFPHGLYDVGHEFRPLADCLSIELCDGADGLPACVADDHAVFGCIIGENELVGGTTVLALKIDLTNRDVVVHRATPPFSDSAE